MVGEGAWTVDEPAALLTRGTGNRRPITPWRRAVDLPVNGEA